MKNLFKITLLLICSSLAFTFSLTLHGQTTAELQTELDAVQAGAGLEDDGSYRLEITDTEDPNYTEDQATNYLGTATSLREADNLLDSALKTESDARTL
jgi:hypothetical protein